jgi:hypothetical protein
LYRPGDRASLAAAVAEAVRRYPELVEAVSRSARELSWAHDEEELRGVYAELSALRRSRRVPDA